MIMHRNSVMFGAVFLCEQGQKSLAMSFMLQEAELADRRAIQF
ncbi:hypothetical protein THPR109532_06180 [Thalassospira profundimaris]